MPEDRTMLDLKFDDEILAVKTFIACVDSGKYKFVQPDPEELDFDGEAEFEVRIRTFHKNALQWLDLYQTQPLSEEFRKLTKQIHSDILQWRLRALVSGEQSFTDTFAENMLMRHENQKIVELYKKLRKENIALAEEVAKFRRPEIKKDADGSLIEGAE
jgi:hypothetical protein